jgi:hypothetical protein
MNAPGERLTRGSAMNGSFGYIQKKWGKEGLEQCKRDIGLDMELKDGGYYPDDILVRTLKWIGREKGMNYVRESGKHTVLNLGMMSWLMRFADIKTVAKRFPKNYSEIYKFGTVEVDTGKPGIIFLRFYDIITYEEAYHSWLGVCEGALEACKTKGRASITKRGDEHPYVEFQIEYEG